MSRVPPTDVRGDGFPAEVVRIREAYARRRPSQRESWFDAGYVFMVQDRERRVLGLLRDCGIDRLDEQRVLEVGCGTGNWLRDFIKWGVRPTNLFGVDLLADRVAIAKRLTPPDVHIECANAAHLPFENGSFDLVLQSMLFTSVLDEALRAQVAQEMTRVVRPGGFILWYDYHVNNPANPDVRKVTRRDVRRLFSGADVRLRRVTLAPPVVRALAPRSQALCRLLNAFPPLRTHYLGVVRKR